MSGAKGFWIEVTDQDGEQWIYPSIRKFQLSTGFSHRQTYSAIELGTVLEMKNGGRIKLRRIQGVRVKPRRSQAMAFHMYWNVIVGLRILAEANNCTMSDIVKGALYAKWPEAELFEMGRTDPRGMPDEKYEPMKPGLARNGPRRKSSRARKRQ